MDLDIMASVQEQIIGNCLCVLGDSMAMPIGSMIEKFRDEFEAHIEARARATGWRRPTQAPEPAVIRAPSPDVGRTDAAPRAADGHVLDRRARGQRARERDARRRRQVRRRRDPGLLLRAQARPAGRRLPHVPGRDRGHPEAPDRLLDAGQGRHGRPHADRARARTPRRRWSSSCSSTTRSTARSATRAASARCRTSPSAGAPGTSRFIEPKRHFQKPLELSPLVAIDRERCILCYRCVRFSQEVAEDYQLVLHERGAHSFVGTFDGHPYVAPFSGNIIELCPVGALTSQRLPLPRAPVGHRGRRARSARCARRSATSRFTVRDERVLRVLGARQRRGRRRLAVRQGPLRLPGRSTSTSASRSRWCATAASCARSAGSARSPRRPRRCARAGAPRRRRSPAARRPTRRASCSQRLLREGLGSRATSTRAPGGDAAARRCTARWRARRCRRRCPTSSSPTPCSCSTASRSTTRRSSTCASARACAATASSSRSPRAGPSSLDPNAERHRCASRPAPARRSLVALDAALEPAARATSSASRRAAGADAGDGARAWRDALRRRRGRRDRLRRAPAGRPARRQRARARCSTSPARSASARARRRRAARVPAGANGRGLREAGVAAHAGPGPRRRRPRPGATPPAIAAGAGRRRADARSTCCTPTRCATYPDRGAVGAARWTRATTVVAHAGFLTDGIREHADVVFPAEAYAEKEGTRHAPRRPRAAPAPGDRPRRATCAPVAGDRRVAAPPGPRPRRADRRDGHRRSSSTRCRSTPA